ncbi:MAG: APC family permease [Candidatus Dormibacteria bacterium]
MAASPTGIAGLFGATVATAFLFAGWETPLYLGEEARERHVNPGKAARLGVLFVLVWYTILVVIFQGMASRHDILAHGSDALSYAGTLALPQPWARLISVAVILAVVAVTQVLLIVGSRLILAMARDGLLPAGLGRVHPRYKTPWVATIVLALIPVIVLIPYLISSGASTAIGDVISSGGLFYLLIYGIVAGTCVWYYRRSIRRGTAAVLVSVVLPLIGGVFLLFAFVNGIRTQTAIVSVVVGVIVVLCLIVGVWGRYSLKVPYFEQHRQSDKEPGT